MDIEDQQQQQRKPPSPLRETPGRGGAGQPPQHQDKLAPPAGPSKTKKKAPVKRRAPRKREKNEYFQDVDQTGKWGSSISKKELVIAFVVLLLLLVGVGAGLYVFVFDRNDDSNNSATPVDSSDRFRDVAATPAPTPAPTQAVSRTVKLQAALAAITMNDFADETTLPTTVADYENSNSSNNDNPLFRGVQYVVLEDSSSPNDDIFVSKLVLATMYYALDGPNWSNDQNWLSPTVPNPCDWYGVVCDRFGKIVREIDIASNNLGGTIPSDMNMMSTLRFLRLSDNNIGGTLPCLALGSLPELSVLYLDRNQLTGTINGDLRDNEILKTLYIYSNNLSGRWPRRSLCPRTGDPPILENFGLDCAKLIACPIECCTENQCFD